MNEALRNFNCKYENLQDGGTSFLPESQKSNARSVTLQFEKIATELPKVLYPYRFDGFYYKAVTRRRCNHPTVSSLLQFLVDLVHDRRISESRQVAQLIAFACGQLRAVQVSCISPTST